MHPRVWARVTVNLKTGVTGRTDAEETDGRKGKNHARHSFADLCGEVGNCKGAA